MLLVSLLFLGLLGSLARGFPLEKPSDTLGNYFVPHIIGGIDAPQGFAIHMAALIFGDQVLTMWCGASIITKRKMLTAAHCIEPLISNNGELLQSFHATVGSNKWNSGGTPVYFKSYHIHPEWDSIIVKNDIAVLDTKKILVLNDNVGLIALSFNWIDAGEDTYVTGWGQTGPRFEGNAVHLAPIPDELQLLYKQTIDSDRCITDITSQQASVSVVPAIEICTFHSRGHGMCNGDSGSALVSERSNKQIGIVSWGLPCATGAPDVFVRLSAYYNFLSEHLTNI